MQIYTRRLATKNRSHVSIRVLKFFGKGGGEITHVKIFLSSSLITMQQHG